MINYMLLSIIKWDIRQYVIYLREKKNYNNRINSCKLNDFNLQLFFVCNKAIFIFFHSYFNFVLASKQSHDTKYVIQMKYFCKMFIILFMYNNTIGRLIILCQTFLNLLRLLFQLNSGKERI